MRYKLRSSSKAGKSTGGDAAASAGCSGAESSTEAVLGSAEEDGTSPPKRPRVLRHRRRKKSSHHHPKDADRAPSNCAITDLPQELVLHIVEFLDSRTMLALLQTSKWFYSMLAPYNSFWKIICAREELSNYQCITVEDDDETEDAKPRLGWRGRPMRCRPPANLPFWRRVFIRGLRMRQNIWQSNYEGWRVYANSNVPVTRLTPDLDLNDVRRRMGDYPKLSENDDLKIDWDEKHLVVFHFFRGEGESCIVRVWDISEEPRFLYSVDKGLESITDKVSVVNGHVVIVPSWPLEAHAIVMALDINDNMSEVGKFIFPDQDRQVCLDDLWEHTQLRVVRNEALVVCRCPEWHLIMVELPSCQPLFEVQLTEVSIHFDCQQIRSYKHTAMILFTRKQNESSNVLVTVDVAGAETKVRSCYPCHDVSDVALFTDPEEIYIMKRNGDVVTYDANTKTEIVKIANDTPMARSINNSGVLSEYQLFVNRKEQICVMQSASEVPQGRHIKVYSYNEQKMYTVNLDLCRYEMSRDESICIYTNGAFLAAADSKKFAVFQVKTGKYLGSIRIPTHLERTKGKEEKDCMFEQTGLSLFIFDEDKLIAVHDYERSFPAVLDIYKFW